MGLFDRVKAMKNALTGGSAKVAVSANGASLTEPFEVTVSAILGDADLKIDKVYVMLRGHEKIEVELTAQEINAPSESNETDGSQGWQKSKTIKKEVHTANLNIDICGEQELKANEEYKWTTTIQIPDNAPPVYEGVNCRHAFYIKAAIDCFGNDPDSGWQKLMFTDA